MFQASLQQIAGTHHQTYLYHETQKTLQTLETLPSHCTHDMDSQIRAKQSQLPGDVVYCSISSMVIDMAEILVDTGFYGFEGYIAIPAFLGDLKDLRTCLNETSVDEMVECALEYLPGTVEAGEVIVGALENYIGEMEMIVPLVVEDIQQCLSSSEKLYKDFLETILVKATTCAQ